MAYSADLSFLRVRGAQRLQGTEMLQITALNALLQLPTRREQMTAYILSTLVGRPNVLCVSTI